MNPWVVVMGAGAGLYAMNRSSWISIDDVLGAIDRWAPDTCETEKDFEVALYQHLLGVLHGKRGAIVQQYGHGCFRTDIGIEGWTKIGIEIKKDLVTTAEYQRLLGQIEEDRRHFQHHVVLICGSVAPALKSWLTDRVPRDGLDGTATVYLKFKEMVVSSACG